MIQQELRFPSPALDCWRGDEGRSGRFKAIRNEVRLAFPELRKPHVHRIAIFVLRQRGASFTECFQEAASATSDHTLVALRWTRERVEGDAEFADRVKRLAVMRQNSK
jgi:hypothetical protein